VEKAGGLDLERPIVGIVGRCGGLKGIGRLAVQLAILPVQLCGVVSDLEQNRGTIARTRNLRLTAIRSFFRYTAYQEPQAPDKFSRSCQFQANDMIVDWLDSLLGKRLRLCSTHLTFKHGMGAAIVHSL
jgi:hypothetical protein